MVTITASVMEVILVDVAGLLRRVDADLERAQRELALAQHRVSELIAVKQGLILAAEIYPNAVKPSPTLSSQFSLGDVAKPATQERIMDAVERVLLDAAGNLTTAEVHQALAALGRSEDHDQVRASLGYLKRIGKIERVGRGVWRAPRNAETPAATGVSDPDPSTSDRSWEEGGTRNAGADSSGHHRPGSPRGPNADDSDLRASVVEAIEF